MIWAETGELDETTL